MKHRYFILLLLFFQIFQTNGQITEEINNTKTDSLQLLLSKLTDTEKIDTLNSFAFRIYKDFPDSSKKLAGQAIILSDSLNYHKGLADGYINLGRIYLIEDSLFLAMINMLNAERIYEQIGSSFDLAMSYTGLAFINNFIGRPQSRINYDRKAINVLKQIDSTGLIPMRYNHIAGGYMQLGEYDSAIFNNQLAIFHADSSINPWFYNTFGLIYLSQFYESGDTIFLAKAIEWLKKGLNSPEIDDYQKAGINDNLFHAYYAYENKEMDNLALYHLNQIIPNAVKSKEAFYTIPGSWLNRGKLSKRGLRFDSAIIYYNKSLNIIDSALSNFSTSGFLGSFYVLLEQYYLKRHKSEAYYLLYEVYSTTGDYRKALENYINYKNASEEIYEEDTKNLVAMLEAESENEKTLNQIALLEKENEVKDLSIRQSRTYLLILLGFILILLFITLLFIRQRRIRMALKEQKLAHDLELNKVETNKLKELDKMKSRFFANISHEFRTPLTLILGPLDTILSKVINEDSRHDMNMIQRNAFRLQNLINQLLSLSKLESGKMKLKVRQEDIVSLSKGYTQSFESLAKQKNINLEFKTSEEIIPVYLDKDKYEQVLYNLISNAFKFTKEEGQIEVRVDSRQLTVDKAGTVNQPALSEAEGSTVNLPANYINITVSDTGTGIPPNKLPHIFDRFYQADDGSNNYQEGTGIGLALAKELVELHHGKISVESEISKGATFKVELQMGTDHFLPEDFVFVDELEKKDDDSLITIEQESYPETFIEPEDNKDEGGEAALTAEDTKPLLLIVEDNADMRHYIHSNISGDFRLIEAEDGAKGYEKAIDKIPDLIISDVMMPIMDGIELCRKLKTDERTSHIPLILLTAKAAMEDRLEGLETGADDFLTKPFDVQELIVRVKNLILQRKKLHEWFARNTNKMGLAEFLNLPDSELNSADQKFLMKVVDIINTNLQNEEFNTEVLQHELRMSNAQLFRKLKALMGMPASGFIRSIRLNRAAELLVAKKGNVSEIAFEVGFNNLSYFSKCFQEQFGVLPSEYKP